MSLSIALFTRDIELIRGSYKAEFVKEIASSVQADIPPRNIWYANLWIRVQRKIQYYLVSIYFQLKIEEKYRFRATFQHALCDHFRRNILTLSFSWFRPYQLFHPQDIGLSMAVMGFSFDLYGGAHFRCRRLLRLNRLWSERVRGDNLWLSSRFVPYCSLR